MLYYQFTDKINEIVAVSEKCLENEVFIYVYIKAQFVFAIRAIFIILFI